MRTDHVPSRPSILRRRLAGLLALLYRPRSLRSINSWDQARFPHPAAQDEPYVGVPHFEAQSSIRISQDNGSRQSRSRTAASRVQIQGDFMNYEMICEMEETIQQQKMPESVSVSSETKPQAIEKALWEGEDTMQVATSKFATCFQSWQFAM